MQPDLFGLVSDARVGPHCNNGTGEFHLIPTQEEAQSALAKQRKPKERRGRRPRFMSSALTFSKGMPFPLRRDSENGAVPEILGAAARFLIP